MPHKPTIKNRSTHSDERRAWLRQAKEVGLQGFLYKASLLKIAHKKSEMW
jgi:hypothetical protein